ncbi:LADA_0H05666g1_1 [Lachancea dasiensis]|uniref:LADA_0H05666g1_1 n=1 Tax=Lachancea dasiensis TaxID=1072105 RepID=A0A1G4K1A8_9SACH|nr:LADA_0H05666g1_1 [Lachancea dasiensis]
MWRVSLTIVCVLFATVLQYLSSSKLRQKIIFTSIAVAIPFTTPSWQIIPFLLLALGSAVFFRLVRLLWLEEFQVVPDPTVRGVPPQKTNIDEAHVSSKPRRPLFPQSQDISREVELIIDNIVRDFVASWYGSFDDNLDAPFLMEIKDLLDLVARNIQLALSTVNLPILLVLKILPLITEHVVAFKAAHKTVLGTLTTEERLKEDHSFAIAVEFGRQYSIHKSISLGSGNLSLCIENYSRANADFLLQNLVPPTELSSRFVKVVGREILGCCLLSPILKIASDADHWNVLIASVSNTLLKERYQVKEFRAALSSQVEGTPQKLDNKQHSKGDTLLHQLILESDAGGKNFEELLKRVSSIETKGALMAAKFSILLQLLRKKKSNEVDKKDSLIVNRLLLALNLIENRLKYLSTNLFQLPPSKITFNSAQIDSFEKFVSSITLDDILKDRLSSEHFSEFLQLNDTKMYRCLRFWQKIEDLKNPLEDPSNDELAMTSDDDFECLVKVSSEYFSGRNLFIMQSLNEQCVSDIQLFQDALSKDDNLLAHQFYQTARRSALQLQTLAYDVLGTSFQNFKLSQQFVSMIATVEFPCSDDYQKATTGSQCNYKDMGNETSPTVLTQVIDSPAKSFRNLPVVGEAGESEPRGRKSFSNLFGENEGSSLFENKLFEDDNSMDELEGFSEDDASDYLNNSEASRKDFNEDTDPNLVVSSLNQYTLKNTIAELTISIDKLKKQLSLLNHLGLKADLTDSTSERRILRKSERAVIKEMHQQELLREQLIVQENDNSLFGKCQTCIKAHLSDISPKSGQEVVYYVISVNHYSDGRVTSWDIPRRYSEFYELNAYLKRRYRNLVKHLQNKDFFPERVKMSLIYHVSKTLLYKERTVKLEKYLRGLLAIPEICQDISVRKFLTDTNSAFSIKETSENFENRKNLLSRIDSVSSKLFDNAVASSPFDNLACEEELELDGLGSRGRDLLSSHEESSKKGSFIKAICDLFVALFAFSKSRSSWLRGRALLVVIQQLLGGTVEKYVKDLIDRITSEDNISEATSKIRSKLWVQGIFLKSYREGKRVRQKRERSKSKLGETRNKSWRHYSERPVVE